jgi:hypothetical protein
MTCTLGHRERILACAPILDRIVSLDPDELPRHPSDYTNYCIRPHRRPKNHSGSQIFLSSYVVLGSVPAVAPTFHGRDEH